MSIRSASLTGALAMVAVLAAAAPSRADDLRPLCPDRPAKGSSACTVDQGHWQIESDIFDAAFDRSGGVSTTVVAAPGPVLKYGLTDNLEVAAGVSPFVWRRVRDGGTGLATTSSGIGDLTLDAKLNLVGQGPGADGGFMAAILAFVKAPTANHQIGNGAWEGGLLAPLQWSLPGDWQLGLTPEADAVLNASGAGRHLALSLPIGLGRSISKTVNVTAEYWAQEDYDPSGHSFQHSFDLAVAWQPQAHPGVQWDAGVDFGLNSNTPDLEVYTGVTNRF